MGNGAPCGVAMRLEIKTPKVWSYQERISERCLVGHISHGQGVLDHDPPSTLNYERDDQSEWGV